MLKPRDVLIMCLVGSSFATDSTSPLGQQCAVDADGISEDVSCESPLAFSLLQVSSVPMPIATQLSSKPVVAFKESIFAATDDSLATVMTTSALAIVVLVSVVMWLGIFSWACFAACLQNLDKSSKATWRQLNMVVLKQTLTDNISKASRAAEIESMRVGTSKQQQYLWPHTTDMKQQQSNRYSAFHEMLKRPCMSSITKEIHDFIANFPSALHRTEAAARVHHFLSSTQESILSQSNEFMTEPLEEQKIIVDEGLEKLIICNIYQKIFDADHRDHVEDERLRKHINGLSWVDSTNLGIPPFDRSLLALPTRELQRLDTYKAPKDKLVCIVNACHALYEVLKVAIEEVDLQPKSLSADDFLPLVILVLIIANPPRLHSNLEFIATFRHPGRLLAEDAYFMTALQSAVHFVSEASPEQFDVSREEFDRLYAESLERHA